MYRRIANKPASRMFVSNERVFIRSNEKVYEEQKIYELSLDGEIVKCIPICYSPFFKLIELDNGQWFCWYWSGTFADQCSETYLRIYSLDGELLMEIKGAERYPSCIYVNQDLVYLVYHQIVKYQPLSLRYKKLISPKDFHHISFVGIHHSFSFFRVEGHTELIAMRDNHGNGLEEIYRLDFSESDRWKGFLDNKNLPGTVELLNFYKDDMWVTTPKRVHRIEVSTGKTLEIRDYTLPKFFLDGNMGYSLSSTYYTVMDMEKGELLCDRSIETFLIDGEECYCEFKNLLLHDGNLYVSVRLDGGIHLLTIFDTGTERFVWYDIWGDWPIESVHIIGDRLIAYAEGEVRIYVRSNDSHVAPTDMFLSMN